MVGQGSQGAVIRLEGSAERGEGNLAEAVVSSYAGSRELGEELCKAEALWGAQGGVVLVPVVKHVRDEKGEVGPNSAICGCCFCHGVSSVSDEQALFAGMDDAQDQAIQSGMFFRDVFCPTSVPLVIRLGTYQVEVR